MKGVSSTERRRQAKVFGRNLKALRKARDWNTMDIVRRTQRARATIDRYLSGAGMPLDQDIPGFALALECKPEDLHPDIDLTAVSQMRPSFVPGQRGRKGGGTKWTPEQHRRFRETMAKKRGERIAETPTIRGRSPRPSNSRSLATNPMPTMTALTAEECLVAIPGADLKINMPYDSGVKLIRWARGLIASE